VNTTRITVSILCLLALAACGPDKEELAEAWAACDSATGTPTGNGIRGMVYEVDTINAGSLGVEFTSREYGAGIYGYTYLRSQYENLTEELSEASAVLCAEVATTFFEDCNYPSDANIEFTLKYHHTKARLTLLAWPSGEQVAETTIESRFKGGACPQSVLHEDSEKSRDVYGAVDLEEWLDQYVTITE
jgi:hypothetical protein